MSDYEDPHYEEAHEAQSIAFMKGILAERERVLNQWNYEMTQCKCDDPMGHLGRFIMANSP